MHLLLLLVGQAASAGAFSALGLFPYPGHSHNVFFRAMMEALAERGHQVTVLSSFPQKAPKANYTDVDLSPILPSLVNTFTFEMINPKSSPLVDSLNILNEVAGNSLCRKVFQSEQFKSIMAGAFGHFDVVFTEIFGSDCFAAVAHKLKVPLIGMVSGPDVPWMHERLGSIDNPSCIPCVFGGEFLATMGFLERVRNVYHRYIANYMHQTAMLDGSDEVVREFLGADTPPLAEVVRNTSLVLLNRHVCVNAARSWPPNVVLVGGLHARARGGTAARMDPGLRAWLDGAEHGVILFSMGSLMRSCTLPEAVQRDLLLAFAALPQRVLWKLEANDSRELPANVRTASWIPQSEVLAHPRVVLFITHGGLMGSTEALLAGVPMLGIPLFGDQMANIGLYQSLGVAERLDPWALSRQGVAAAIGRMTETDRYLVRAREVAALHADLPRGPEEEAVWWAEYVVRHGGAPHLRPLGADLPLHQYLLLDVAAAALGLAAVLLLAVRACVRTLRRGSPAPAPPRPAGATDSRRSKKAN